MRKAYEDLEPIALNPGDSSLTLDSLMVVAKNGLCVFVVPRGDVLFCYHKGRDFRRHFSRPISSNWLTRRIDEFADHVASVRLNPGRKKGGN